MVVVKLELWPGGDETQARPLGIIAIANDGTGNADAGNYTAEASHAGRYFGRRREPYKRCRVTGFARCLSPYRLLYRVLKAMGET